MNKSSNFNKQKTSITGSMYIKMGSYVCLSVIVEKNKSPENPYRLTSMYTGGLA